MKELRISTLILACAAFAAASGQAQAAKGEHHSALFEHLCAHQGDPSPHHKLGERLADHLKLNDAQKTAYNDFKEARLKALDDSKARLCAKEPDLSSFEERLVFSQAFIEARLDALKAENPKLIAFYNSLDAKQKKKFDKFRIRMLR
jgi:hypothetical protein